MTPLLALLAFQDAAFDPLKDPALEKPITVHLALSPLRTVVAAIAKESGQALDVSGSVLDFKATVLVKALPAGRTMEALADTLGLVWKKDASAYRLSRPEGSVSAEAAYLKAERADRQGETTAMISGPAVAPGTIVRPNRRRPGGGRQRDPGLTMAEGATKVPYVRFDPNLLAIEGSESPPPTRLEPSVPSGELPFAKAAAAWPSLPKEFDSAGWEAPIAPRLAPSPWEGKVYALSDLLTAWHDATGLPVVADAFRIPAKTRAFNPGSAFGVLQSLAAAEGAPLRLAGGVARLRHPAFWRLRAQEITEATWATFERGSPTIFDYAAFASKLTPAQAASFRSLEAPLSRAKYRTDAFRDSYPALLLWSRLPRPATTALLNGQAVALRQAPGALSAYRFALQEAPYYKAGDPVDVLKLDPNLLGMFGRVSADALDLRLAGERGDGVSYRIPLK